MWNRKERFVCVGVDAANIDDARAALHERSRVARAAAASRVPPVRRARACVVHANAAVSTVSRRQVRLALASLYRAMCARALHGRVRTRTLADARQRWRSSARVGRVRAAPQLVRQEVRRAARLRRAARRLPRALLALLGRPLLWPLDRSSSSTRSRPASCSSTTRSSRSSIPRISASACSPRRFCTRRSRRSVSSRR